MPKKHTAKVSPPRVVRVYPRPRLFKSLNEAKAQPVTWVCGPPGSGKTTLVASYLSAEKQPHIWYQVDSGDTDLATFFSCLRLAVEETARRKRPNLPLLTPEYLLDVATFTRTFFGNLWARLPLPFVLVFDNYHEVGEDAPLHLLIQAGLLQIPEGGRVIFIGRNDPHPAFARLRANQAMTVVDGKALQLTAKEARGLMASRREGKIPNEMRAIVCRHAGGWVAGIILMLDRFHADRRVSHEATPVPGGQPPEAVFDYFLVEVLGRLPTAVQDFLLRSAFLPSLTVAMAERMTDTGFAESTLKELSRRNFFIASYPEGGYRYHDLFRAFLMARARETFPPAELTQVRLSAATTLEEVGRLEEAVELFREARAWTEVVRLILAQAPFLLMQGRFKTLECWIVALPPDISQTDPWILHWRGYCCHLFDPKESREWFEKAYRLFENRDGTSVDTLGVFFSWCGMVNTIFLEWGDFTRLDPWIARMEERLARPHEFPSIEIEARVASDMAFALMYRRPDHPATRPWVERSVALVPGIDSLDVKLQALNSAALYYAFMGDWAKMGRILDLSKAGFRANPASPFETIAYHVLEAIYSWTSGLNEHCFDCVEKGFGVARGNGVRLLDHFLLNQGLFGSLSTGDLQRSSVYLAEMGILLSETRRLSVAQYDYFVAWEAWLRNDLPKALEFSRKSLELALQTGTPFFEALHRLGLVQVLLARGELSEIEAHLKEAGAFGRRMESHLLIFMALLLGTQLKWAQGDEKGALTTLAEALHLGREQGHYNVPWWNEPVMAKFCMIALQEGIEVEYVQALIRRRNLFPDPPPLTCENWPWPIKIFTLGQAAILKEDQPIHLAERFPRKQLELLYTLAAFGKQGIGGEELADALWPRTEGDKAHLVLEKTVGRLRKLLGHNDAIRVRDGWYRLSARHCWVDAWAVTRCLDEIETLIRQTPDETGKERVHRLAVRAHALYKGEFLGRGTPFWLVPHSERLHCGYLRCLRDLGGYWERAAEWERAETCYEKGLELDPAAESLAQRLMTLYQKRGRRAEAMSVYEHLRKVLSATFGIEPGDETRQTYRSLLK